MGGIDDDFFSSPFGLGRSPHGLGTAFRWVAACDGWIRVATSDLIIAYRRRIQPHFLTCTLLGHIHSTFIRHSRKRKFRTHLWSTICTWRLRKLTAVVWKRWKFRDVYCSQMARRRRRTNMWAFRWSQAGNRAQRWRSKRRAIRRRARFRQISCLSFEISRIHCSDARAVISDTQRALPSNRWVSCRQLTFHVRFVSFAHFFPLSLPSPKLILGECASVNVRKVKY